MSDPSAPRTLRRSRDDRVLAGVCAGVARYVGIDVTVVRILAVVAVVLGGPGLLLYAAGWLLMPKEDGPSVVADWQHNRAA